MGNGTSICINKKCTIAKIILNNKRTSRVLTTFPISSFLQNYRIKTSKTPMPLRLSLWAITKPPTLLKKERRPNEVFKGFAVKRVGNKYGR